MAKEMLINTVAGQECRIAIMEKGRLEELYVERASSAPHVSNIYKGRITNVEPAIQAAFIDFGLPKNGFLHISDVHPKYFPGDQNHESEQVGRKRPRRNRPPIQDCLRRGQEVVIQMTKEGIGTKGPTMTTYLSIPGRLLVMMPGMSRLGVSRKVEDPEVRDKARKILGELDLPEKMGFILRTAGLGSPKRELQRDLKYLMRLWDTVKQRIETAKAPAEIYQESDLVVRTIRDVYNADIDRVLCDDETVAKKVQEFLGVAMPRTRHHIELYHGKGGLFHDFGLEEEIEKIYQRRVELRSGGSLVIDQTEALVAIDVNSGRFRQHNDAETTAVTINVEAASEVARQLRLRDLGGVIIIDFIDMHDLTHRRQVEKTLRDAMKNDRAKAKPLKISALGLLEMTRQRIRPSLRDSMYSRCALCDGTGLIKSPESQSLQVMRALQRATSNTNVARVVVAVTPMAAHHLTNFQRAQISQLETHSGKTIVIEANPDLSGEEMTVHCTNSRGSKVAWDTDITKTGKPRIETTDIEDVIKGVKTTETTQAKTDEKTPEGEQDSTAKKSRRRGRRGGRKHKKSTAETNGEAPAAEATAPVEANTPAAMPDMPETPETEQAETAAEDAPAKKSRRRGRRGGRKHKNTEAQSDSAAPSDQTPGETAAPQPAAAETETPAEATETEQAEPAGEQAPAEDAPVKKSRRRGRRGGRKHKKPSAETNGEAPAAEANSGLPAAEATVQAEMPATPETEQAEPAADEAPAKKSRRRGRRGGRRHKNTEAQPDSAAPSDQTPGETAAPQPAAAENKERDAEKSAKKSMKAAAPTKKVAAKKTVSKRVRKTAEKPAGKTTDSSE